MWSEVEQGQSRDGHSAAVARPADRRIGTRLRALRQAHCLPLNQLAWKAGLEPEAITRIEETEAVPSLGMIWRISFALEVPFSALLGDDERGVVVLRQRKPPPAAASASDRSIRPLLPATASRSVEICELSLGAGNEALGLHARGSTETLTVLGGRLSIRVKQQTHELALGDTISFPGDLPHVYQNPGDAQGLYHSILAYDL